jgi:hypothetical protein
LADKTLARSSGRIGGAFSYPERLQDETIEMYFRPIVASPLKMSQVDEYLVALGTNDLVAIRKDLQAWQGAARLVWGLKDQVFGVQWAEWLDRTLPNSRGIRRVEDAKVFFPEEMPDVMPSTKRRSVRVLPLLRPLPGDSVRLTCRAATQAASLSQASQAFSLLRAGDKSA